MADVLASAPASPADPQRLTAEPQEASYARAAMAPRRHVRATMSPSPAPHGRASTPARDPVTGRLGPDRGGAVRTPLPAKYSTSYGSPITQLPDRSNVGGGVNLTKAAAEIFTKVKKDNLAAEARRRIRDQARAARAPRLTASPPPRAIQPTIEVEGLDEEASEAEAQSEEETSGEEGSEYEDEDASRTKGRRAKRLPRQAARKRARDDEEADARAEREREERDARLRRKRSAEAQSRVDQKLAEAQAAAERLAQQTAREEAARAAMPPPPHPPVPRGPLGIVTTPASRLIGDVGSLRPPSARSFIEESNIFLDAEFQTTTPPLAEDVRQPAPAPQVAPVQPEWPEPLTSPPPESISPPSVLRKAPIRPTARILGPSRLREPEIPDSTSPIDEDRSRYESRGFQYAASSFATQIRNRLKPLPDRLRREERETERRTSDVSEGERPQWRKLQHFFSLRSVLWTMGAAYIMLFLIRQFHLFVRPDQFEMPVATLNWYGWRDWSSNVGQFFPTPLLHPLGVLSNDQYDDLKDYLQRRTTTTEAAVDNLKSIIPKVVSVRKDKSGKIVISDEFWNALKDLVQQDESILTLDGKSRISDKHWKAVQARLKDAGLLGKPLSADEVERIVDRAAPASWEKWARKNQRKVADILGQIHGKGQSSAKGADETVVTRQEFIRELSDRLAQNKKQIDSEMDSLRMDLGGLVQEIKATASAGGMAKAEITALVKQAVSKEIGDRQLKAATKTSVASVDAALRRQVNHLDPGNGAVVDLSLRIPTWEPEWPRIGTRAWFRAVRRQPRFQPDPVHALTAWTDPGHCWCAGTGGQNPAYVAVRLAHSVIPRYVVLEHIDPSATTDPRAMPRNVEIWAAFDEHARRERVLDWMAATFPDDSNNHDRRSQRLVAMGFAKIGRFAYEHRPRDGGVFVHKLSDELERMGAATDLVLVRAVSNYGAEDHTCFYRVRMYGDVVEDLEAERESRTW